MDSLYEKFCLLPCCNTRYTLRDRGSLESSRGFQLRMSFKESRRKIDGVQDSMKVWRRYSVLGNKRNEDIHMQRRVHVYVSGL